MTRRRQASTYFLLGVALWFIVDWGTAGGFRPAYLAAYMPALLVFYLGCPAVFTYLVFRQRLGTRGLIVATLVKIVFVEAVATGMSTVSARLAPIAPQHKPRQATTLTV